MSATTLDLYGRLQDAFREGTLESFEAIVAREARYVIHGHSRLSGTYLGPEGMVEWSSLARQLSAGTARFELSYTVEDEEHLVVRGDFHGTRNGQSARFGHVYLYRWESDRLVHGETVATDTQAFDDFWS